MAGTVTNVLFSTCQQNEVGSRPNWYLWLTEKLQSLTKPFSYCIQHPQTTLTLYKWSLPTAFPTISNVEVLELWLSCTLILHSHTFLFRKQEHCSKTGQIQRNPTLSNWIMTFFLAQSPSNIFVFSVLHFTTYALLDTTLNLSDLIHFLLLKKTLRNHFLSNYCLHSAGCNSKPPASNTACSHNSSKNHLHMWVMFPERWQSVLSPLAGEGRSCSVHPIPAFPLPAIVCLLLHLGSCRGRELCPPGKTGPAPPLLETGDVSSLQLSLRCLACEELQPRLSMSRAAEREPGTLPLECISRCCVRRVSDLHHSWDMYLYTFLNMFV